MKGTRKGRNMKTKCADAEEGIRQMLKLNDLNKPQSEERKRNTEKDEKETQEEGQREEKAYR